MATAKLYHWNMNSEIGKWDFEKDFLTTEENAIQKIESLPNVDSDQYFYKFELIADDGETKMGEVFTLNCFLFL